MSIASSFQYGLSSLPSPFELIPNTISNSVIVAIFNQVFKRAINEGELDFLNNHWVMIDISDIKLTFVLGLKNNKLIEGSKQINYDLSICAKSCDFLSMVAKQKDPDTLFFQRKIKMQGSTELGLYVKNFLDAFDVESHWFSHKTEQLLQTSYPFLKKILCKNN